MRWESSVAYEGIMTQEVRRPLGGTHSADLIVRSYDFAEIERLQAEGDWDAARGAACDRCASAWSRMCRRLDLLHEHHAPGGLGH